MKKRLGCFITALLMLLCSACGTATEPSAEGIELTDDLGREVIVEPSPERVAVLIGSFADLWCLAGGRESIAAAADDSWTEFELGLGENVINLGGVKTPSVEKLLAAEPQLVIGSARTAADVALAPMLEELGIPVLYFDVSSFEDYLRMLNICCTISGHPENYETYGTSLQTQVDAAVEKATGAEPEVLYVRASGKSCRVKGSGGTVLGEMLSDLGCRNIADSDSGLLEQLSMETIIARDPDYIFAVLQGSDSSKAEESLERALLSDPAWNSLSAVREGRFYILDQKLYNLKPNARWGEAYEKLADIIYGEE